LSDWVEDSAGRGRAVAGASSLRCETGTDWILFEARFLDRHRVCSRIQLAAGTVAPEASVTVPVTVAGTPWALRTEDGNAIVNAIKVATTRLIDRARFLSGI
jgi:hypothetical protein